METLNEFVWEQQKIEEQKEEKSSIHNSFLKKTGIKLVKENTEKMKILIEDGYILHIQALSEFVL